MKNLIKKTAVVFAASLLLVGCEKDDAFEPSQSNSQTNSKNKSVNNKVDITDVDTVLSQFLEDMYYENTPAVAIEAENALLYSEAFLNWKYSHNDKVSAVSKRFELTYDLSLTNSGGSWEASGNDLLTMNQAIENSLVDLATDSSLDGISSGSKYWSNIHVVLPTAGSYSSNTTVIVVATLSGARARACSFIWDWKGYVRGHCAQNSTNTYLLVDEIEDLVNNNCSANNTDGGCPGKYRPPHSNHYYYYVKFRFNSASTNGFDNANLWIDLKNGCARSTFINQTEIPEIRSYGDNNRPIHNSVTSKINFYDLDRGKDANAYLHWHTLEVNYYNLCKQVRVDLLIPSELEHVLKPSF